VNVINRSARLRSPSRQFSLALAAFLALGCAAGAEADPTQFDAGAGVVAWRVHGDGFLSWGQRRLPVDAAILELRLQTRAMPSEALLQLVVDVRPDPVEGQEVQVVQEVERLWLELEIMGVKQVRMM